MILTGQRVHLRAFGSDPGDHERLVAWRADPETSRWFLSGGGITLESHLAWFQALQADPAQLYWAIDALPGRGASEGPMHIGTVGLILDPAAREAEFARYLVGDLRFRGRGYAPEAALLVLEHAFGELGLERVRAEYVAGNEPVARLYPRYGFRAVEGAPGVVRMTLEAEDFRERAPELRRLLGLAGV